MAWMKPTEGFYKVNVNGVSQWEGGQCAIGCVMRNDDGDYYRGFGGVFRCSDPMVASLQAICHGLELAWLMGRKKLILETDDAAALEKILQPDRRYKYWTLVGVINQWMDQRWESLQLGYVSPSANGAAAALADHYLDNGMDFSEMIECPDAVRVIVEEEK